MMNVGRIVAFSLGVTFMIWGVLFGLNQIGTNGVLIPEFTAILPIIILWVYAIYVYITDERNLG
jgi:lipopolysaccharide export system permease protein